MPKGGERVFSMWLLRSTCNNKVSPEVNGGLSFSKEYKLCSRDYSYLVLLEGITFYIEKRLLVLFVYRVLEAKLVSYKIP